MPRVFEASRRAARAVPAWLAVGAVGGALAFTGSVLEVASAAEEVPYPVTIDGSGDTDIVAELVSWQNELFAADQPVDFQYFQRGSKDGRAQLLVGLSDFTVSGVGFTAAELAARPEGAGEIIDAPLSVGSTAIVITRPAQTGWDTETESPCDLTDPFVDPDAPECQTVRGELTGPIRIPAENLGAMIVALPGDAGGLTTWTHPDLVDSLGTADLIIQNRPAAHATFLNRTEGTSASMSLQLYANELAPTAWAAIVASDPTFAWEPIGEVFSPRTPSRYGLDTQLGLMSLSNTDPISNSTPANWTGNMGPIPTTLVPKLLRDNPDDGYRVVEVQNANGDWVAPTRESLDASLAAGTSMNVAAFDDVPGAYPLVHINRLYTVAGTLAPDEANALAAAIRFIATDGQQTAIDNGGTDLPDDLRLEALAKADAIVEANCGAEGYEVTTSGPSRFEPSTPGVQALTSMQHCTLVPVPATTTTTTEAPTTTSEATTTTAAPTTVPATLATSPPAAAPPFVPQRSSPSPSPAPVVVTSTSVAASPDTTTTSTTVVLASEPPASTPELTGGAGARPRGVALTQLPMVRPDDGSEGFKKLGTLMLGAALFLFGRRMVQARRPAP